MTLVELAMQKKYQDSKSNSQCSFDSRDNSRESFNSKESKGSMRSKSSKKESSIPMKENTFTNFNRPPIQKLRSN